MDRKLGRGKSTTALCLPLANEQMLLSDTASQSLILTPPRRQPCSLTPLAGQQVTQE